MSTISAPLVAHGSEPQCAPAALVLPTPEAVEALVLALRRADPAFAAIISRSPHRGPALRRIGQALAQAQQGEAAIAVLSASVACAPESAESWTDLALAFNSGDQAGLARVCVDEAVRLQPNLLVARLASASMYAQENKLLNARADYARALFIDENSIEASFGLGLVYFRGRQFANAATHLEKAIAAGVDEIGAHSCLAQAYFLQGEFSAAVAAMTPAVQANPDAADASGRLDFYRFVDDLQHQSPEAALAALATRNGGNAVDNCVLTRRAFEVLSTHGHVEAARRLGEYRLAHWPDDIVQRHHLAALSGVAFGQAPHDYVIDYFDRFAASFEDRLVGALDYRVPETLATALATLDRAFDTAIDLGCGTGLCGPLLRPLAGRLLGVDLSAQMLAQAGAKQVYDDLAQADVGAFLEARPHAADLLVAADLLIYFGALEPLLAAAAACLKPGGVFAFSIETTNQADYVLQANGRFAQTRQYTEVAAKAHFRVLHSAPTTLRFEAARPVAGAIYLLERLPAAG